MPWIGVDPRMNSLRNDPRFQSRVTTKQGFPAIGGSPARRVRNDAMCTLLADLTATAERAKQVIGMRELVDRRFGVNDFGNNARGIGEPPERLLVRPGVIADPVTFGMRALGNRAPLGIRELRAEHEECRLDVD